MAPLLTLPNNNLQPAVVELADGSLFALMRNGAGGGFTWEARSKDCTLSWAMKERHDLPNPGSGIDMIRLSDGRLLLAYNPSATDRAPLSVSLSDDDGRSWSSPKTIEAGAPQLSYPSLVQARDGVIHAAYSHRLDHIQHVAFNTAWLESSPGVTPDQ
jgi:predicted neuraminidase